MSGALSFSIVAQDRATAARRGSLTTRHGTIATPAFMPVGTAATVKAMTSEDVAGLGYGMILANSYHLTLRPGEEVIRRLGGLHRFMNWKGGILTDSGGFQVLSLAQRRSISDDGVVFRSHIDGSRLEMTPERSMAIQQALGSDIAMAFDDCPPLPSPRERLEAAVGRTTLWARRCRSAWGDRGGGLFGIVQGGSDAGLRARSAGEIVSIGFDGYAIGGVSVGESAAMSRSVVEMTAPLLPPERPRYLMGMGTPADLVEMVPFGVDLFDCVLPTRNARNGCLFTASGRLQIKRSEFRNDGRPIDETCGCAVCRNYSRAYLRHLYVSGEILSMRLNTLHNLHHYAELMKGVRAAIDAGRYDEFRRSFRAQGRPGGAEGRDGDSVATPEDG